MPSEDAMSKQSRARRKTPTIASDLESEICRCSCHFHPGSMHVVPCCYPCPKCGNRIRLGCVKQHSATCPTPDAGQSPEGKLGGCSTKMINISAPPKGQSHSAGRGLSTLSRSSL